VRRISGPFCERCGGKLSQTGLCDRCIANPPSFTALRACTFYEGPIRSAILKLKYGGNIALGEILARPMISLLRDLDWKPDLIVPVPGSLARRKMRGYNQASLLALPVALSCGIPYRSKALVKVRHNRTQVGLSMLERQANVSGAFLGRKELVAGKTVLIIDDVTTSGATLEACTAALLDQGARQVYGLTLARAVLDHSV
jgi:competence protein ComFC